MLCCESLLTIIRGSFAWMIHSKIATESSVFIFTAVTSCLAGFHRPALESLTPRLVAKTDLPKISSLQGFRGTFAHIVGPAIGGMMIAAGGAARDGKVSKTDSTTRLSGQPLWAHTLLIYWL